MCLPGRIYARWFNCITGVIKSSDETRRQKRKKKERGKNERCEIVESCRAENRWTNTWDISLSENGSVSLTMPACSVKTVSPRLCRIDVAFPLFSRSSTRSSSLKETAVFSQLAATAIKSVTTVASKLSAVYLTNEGD